MIKSPDTVKAECSTAGISTEDTIYFYCFKGARAQHLSGAQAGRL